MLLEDIYFDEYNGKEVIVFDFGESYLAFETPTGLPANEALDFLAQFISKSREFVDENKGLH